MHSWASIGRECYDSHQKRLISLLHRGLSMYTRDSLNKSESPGWPRWSRASPRAPCSRAAGAWHYCMEHRSWLDSVPNRKALCLFLAESRCLGSDCLASGRRQGACGLPGLPYPGTSQLSIMVCLRSQVLSCGQCGRSSLISARTMRLTYSSHT